MYKLRELERTDMPIINTWRNNPDLISHLGAPFRYINQEVDNNWFDVYMKNRNTTIRCVIFDTEKPNIPIGLVSLVNINPEYRSAELSIMIGEESNTGKGYGKFAVKEILNHAFNNLNLHRVQLSVLETNTRAIALYEKVGFKLEGTKREAVLKNGVFINLLQYSILCHEYCD